MNNRMTRAVNRRPAEQPETSNAPTSLGAYRLGEMLSGVNWRNRADGPRLALRTPSRGTKPVTIGDFFAAAAWD